MWIDDDHEAPSGGKGVLRTRVRTTEIVWSPSVLLDVWHKVIQRASWLANARKGYKDKCYCKINGVYGTETSKWYNDRFDLYNIIDDFKIGYSLTAMLKEECECHGFYMRSGHAFSCKAGFYNDGNCSSTCKACPVGRWSEEGASS